MGTEKVLVAMSGGVDSSVAAKLLTDAGYDCVGCMMKLYDNEDAGIPKGHTCCSLDDAEDARSVARRLGFPFYVFNLKDKFAACVIDRFVDAYEHGVTPNPCIDCNRYLKFDKLLSAPISWAAAISPPATTPASSGQGRSTSSKRPSTRPRTRATSSTT